MTIYLCLDDRKGLQFNKRRLSRDAAVLEDLRRELPGTLTIEAFSEKLIAGAGIPCTVAEEIPADAHFFCESKKAEGLLPLAEKLVIYWWNRHYPSDLRWEAEPAEFGFVLSETLDFPGKSHETITKEVYVK